MVGSQVPKEGLLQVSNNGTDWGTICGDNFTEIAQVYGKALCQLYGYQAVTVLMNYKGGTGPILISMNNCQESTGPPKSNCITFDANHTLCDHSKDLGLSCSLESLPSSPPSRAPPSPPDKKGGGQPDTLTIVSAVVGSVTGTISAVAAVFGLMCACKNASLYNSWNRFRRSFGYKTAAEPKVDGTSPVSNTFTISDEDTWTPRDAKSSPDATVSNIRVAVDDEEPKIGHDAR
ncbi:hypothetical protein Vretimale_7110 [Volvox reticuliferus]|nr:hypothetical protein Vretimale_7110 [Volvox reticuliferus]